MLTDSRPTLAPGGFLLCAIDWQSMDIVLNDTMRRRTGNHSFMSRQHCSCGAAAEHAPLACKTSYNGSATMEDDWDKSVSLKLRPHVKQALDAACAREGRTRNNLVGRIVTAWLEQTGFLASEDLPAGIWPGPVPQPFDPSRLPGDPVPGRPVTVPNKPKLPSPAKAPEPRAPAKKAEQRQMELV
jgi:hypothetical protein